MLNRAKIAGPTKSRLKVAVGLQSEQEHWTEHGHVDQNMNGTKL